LSIPSGAGVENFITRYTGFILIKNIIFSFQIIDGMV